MMRTPLAAAAAVLAMVLAGCSGSPVVAPDAGRVAISGGAEPEPTADLVAMKKAAGIADCPRSDADVAAVPSGLPDVVLPCLGGGRECGWPGFAASR